MLLLDSNSEQGFVFASMMEFLSCWKAKQEATINIQCKEGRAMLNFSCSLGEPEQPHMAEGPLRKKRKTKKTKSQILRDSARAAAQQAAGGVDASAAGDAGASADGDAEVTDVDFEEVKEG